uniref:Transmembrane protein 72 n=1 Tax=Xiphophorus couchianus TaxID=32473 RepID=A0A3B5M883_9TELE
ETVQQGEFNSLGIYLICPPNWQVFVLWGKMARVGGFHKFLYYSIMSVVCFLHPVLVWHAIIPGSMLLVTAFFNFILSKKAKTKSPKSPPESNGDQSQTTVTERSGSNGTSSFFQAVMGRKGGEMALTDPDYCFEPQDRGESVQAMLEQVQTVAPAHTERRKRGWKEMIWFREREEPVEREMEEMNDDTPFCKLRSTHNVFRLGAKVENSQTSMVLFIPFALIIWLRY